MSEMKVKIPYINPKTNQQEERMGTDISFNPLTPESWQEYELADGSLIKIRQVLNRVIRIDDEFNPDGSPVYTIQAQGSLAVGNKIKIKCQK